MAFSDGGYTTNLPLADVTDGKAWVVDTYDGQPLEPEHGGPAGLLVPHLYFWKSAKWVRGLALREQNEPGFWESLGYHDDGDPWRERSAHERLQEQTVAVRPLRWTAASGGRRTSPTTARAARLLLEVPDWPGHLPGQHVDVRGSPPTTATPPSAATPSPPRRSARG